MNAQQGSSALVVIPTYNEINNIQKVVTSVFHSCNNNIDILIVDDSSPDGTGQEADKIARDNPHVFTLHRPHKSGLAAAYLTGFSWGIERGYDFILEFDADGSHPASSIPAMLEAALENDLVIGSRWIKGGATKGWPLFRKMLSKGASAYCRLMLRSSLRDITSGFRAYRSDVLRDIVGDITSTGYVFQIEMAYRAERKGYKIKEIPIVFSQRQSGMSKISAGIIIEALFRVTIWGLNRKRAFPSKQANATFDSSLSPGAGISELDPASSPSSSPVPDKAYASPTRTSFESSSTPSPYSSVQKAVTTDLPTSYGTFKVHGYTDSSTNIDHLAIVHGPITDPVNVRVHSECLTGEVFCSLKCECRPQLESTMKYIAQHGGVILYLRGHEGRGIGIINKLRAYRLQEDGLDTVDANLKLGFGADERDYTPAALMLKDMGIKRINLLTNNPDKQRALEACGIEVCRLIPLKVGKNEINKHYLDVKQEKMGHLL